MNSRKTNAVVSTRTSSESGRDATENFSQAQCPAGFESWALSNNSANIRRYKERLATLTARRERQAAAENSVNGVLIQEKPDGHLAVTFAEKPDYSVISAMKIAGFRWCRSYWYGKKETLPAEVKKLMKGE